MNYGYVKLHRSLLEWQYWNDHDATRLLIYLLVAVNFEEKKWMGITIEKGSLITSFDSLSRETGLTTKKLRRCLKLLIKDNQIIQKTTNKYQSITLIKWDDLQCETIEEGKQKANKGQAKGKQRATTKESKESKESNNSTNIELLISRKNDFKISLEPFLVYYGKTMLNEFFSYWTEPNKSNTKMKFELQQTWDIERRLSTWSKNDKQFNAIKNGTRKNDDGTALLAWVKGN